MGLREERNTKEERRNIRGREKYGGMGGRNVKERGRNMGRGEIWKREGEYGRGGREEGRESMKMRGRNMEEKGRNVETRGSYVDDVGRMFMRKVVRHGLNEKKRRKIR